MPSEDITFCANRKCTYTKCERNMKNIRLDIPHSVAMFPECKKWKDSGAKWLIEQIGRADDGRKAVG